MPVFPIQMLAALIAISLFMTGGMLARKNDLPKGLTKMSIAGVISTAALIAVSSLQKFDIVDGEWGRVIAFVFEASVLYAIVYISSGIVTEKLRRYPFVVCGGVALSAALLTMAFATATTNPATPMWFFGSMSFIVTGLFTLFTLVTAMAYDGNEVGSSL